MRCTRLAENAGPKNVAKNRHLGTIAQLCRAISSQLRHVLTIGKKLFSSNISSTGPYNVVNLGKLAAEIVSLVWGTPGNFNGFRVLAALLHGTPVVGVSQTAALNRGRHLYSAGRPSRWAFAHISSLCNELPDPLCHLYHPHSRPLQFTRYHHHFHNPRHSFTPPIHTQDPPATKISTASHQNTAKRQTSKTFTL